MELWSQEKITTVNLKCLCDDPNKAKFVLDGMVTTCLVCGYKETIVGALTEAENPKVKEYADQRREEMKNPVDEHSKNYHERRLNKNKTEAKASLIRQIKGETE